MNMIKCVFHKKIFLSFAVHSLTFHIRKITYLVFCIVHIRTVYVYLNAFWISSLRVICFDFLPKMRYFTHMRTANTLIIAKFNCDRMHRRTNNTIHSSKLFSMCDSQVVFVDDFYKRKKERKKKPAQHK